MKIDFTKEYHGRLEEIEKQIGKEIRLKHWGKKKLLENERARIENLLNDIEGDKDNGLHKRSS